MGQLHPQRDRPAPCLLSLAIALERSIYRGEEPVGCTMTLRNDGVAPALINTRMLVSLKHARGEVYFRVRDDLGAAYVYNYIVIPRPVAASDFVALQPGEEVVKDYELRDLYALASGRTYTVQAFYRNLFAHPDPGTEAWVGEVASNIVEFSVGRA